MMAGYLVIERPDSPILLVEPEVSLGGGGVLVFVRAAETAAQAERVVVGPPATFSLSVSFHSPVDDVCGYFFANI